MKTPAIFTRLRDRVSARVAAPARAAVVETIGTFALLALVVLFVAVAANKTRWEGI